MNPFFEQFERKNRSELTDILKNSDKYQKEAVEAATEILKNKFHYHFEPVTDTTKTTFRFKLESSSLFPIKYLGYVGLSGALGLIGSVHIIAWISIVLICLGIIYLDHLFSRREIQIDLKNKKLTKTIGFSKNSASFQKIENFRISSKEMSQRLNSRGSTRVIFYTVYHGFATIDGVKILLVEGRNKKNVVQQFHKLAQVVGLPVEE